MRQLELKGRRLTASRARAWGAPAAAIAPNKLGQAMGAKGRATRQRLLDAAVRLLRADPPVALSAVTVARAAQSSSAAFYLYFNDVPDLFHALGEQACQDARAVLGIARESWRPDNLDIQASRLVDAFFGAWSVHRPVLRYRNIEADRGDPRFVALRRDVCLPLIEALAQRIWQELEVVTPSTSFPVRRMSGGNVQKVLVGREIAQAPAVLMTAYAVRGLDINTSYTIYNLLTEQKMKGIALMYVGEDLDVLLELCDRIVVLCGGQVSGVVDARTTDKHQVGALMTLVNKGGKADE